MNRSKSTGKTSRMTPSRKQFLTFGLGTLGAAFITAGCSSSESEGGEGGSGAPGQGGSTGAAGQPGQGGSTGVAGAPGQGGSTGVAGSPGQGGSTGVAGSPGQGGSTGAAGSPGNGGSTGAAGSPGNGGSTGTAGSPGRGGSTGTAGSPGGGGAGGSTTANSCTGAISAAISGNHGHSLMIPMADVVAGTQKCYNAMGTATHAHYVTLSAADFVTLRNGGNVTKYSCNGGDHQFVLSCKSGAPAPVAPPECDANSNVGGTAC